MKIEMFPLKSAERQSAADRVKGKVTIPQGSKIIHVGATPPTGEMCVFCEVSPVTTPDEEIDVVVLRDGDVIPRGHEYMGYILAVPILFIYRRKDKTIVM